MLTPMLAGEEEGLEDLKTGQMYRVLGDHGVHAADNVEEDEHETDAPGIPSMIPSTRM